MSTSVRLTTGFALCLAILIAVPTNCCAEDRADAASSTVEWKIPDSTTILDALRQASELLGVQIIANKRDKNISNKTIDGTPTLRGSQSEVLGDFRSLLVAHELVLLPIGKASNHLYFAMDVKQSGSILKLRAEPIEINDANAEELETQSWRYVTTSIHVRHIHDLRNMRTALSKLVTGSSIGQITEAPQANAFVMTDFAPNVVSAYRLIKQMDVDQGAPRTGYRVTVVRLGNAKAKDLATLISGLFAAAPPKRPSAAPRVVADERTNQIIISGDAAAVAEIEAMVHRLDTDLAESATPQVTQVNTPKVTEIKYLQAEDIATMLKELALSNGAQTFESRPTVVSIPARNAVLVVGSEHTHRVVASLIAQVDVPAKTNADD